MKVISWNCNLKFAKKFEAIESFNPNKIIKGLPAFPIHFMANYLEL